MKVSSWGALVLAVCCVGLVVVSSASAKGRIDLSFGQSGVVDLDPDGAEPTPQSMEIARGGAILVTEQTRVCAMAGCSGRASLTRYRRDGLRDSGFGVDGTILVAPEGVEGEALLAVDSMGRMVLAWTHDYAIVIRRFEADGRPDLSFGQAGFSQLSCGCILTSLAAGPNDSIVVAGRSERPGYAPFSAATALVARLRSDGGFDSKFGQGGIVWMRTPGYRLAAKVGPRGAVFLFDLTRNFRLVVPLVTRLSARGRLDWRFARTAKRSLRAAQGTGTSAYGWEDIGLVLRPRGKVDLYGNDGEDSLVVRLLRSGKRDRSFGRNGVQRISFPINDAVADGAGGTFAVGRKPSESFDDFRVLRLRPDGRPDRQFGRVVLPGTRGDEGVQLGVQAKGKVAVFDQGLHFCRSGGCGVDPKLFRVLRGRG